MSGNIHEINIDIYLSESALYVSICIAYFQTHAYIENVLYDYVGFLWCGVVRVIVLKSSEITFANIQVKFI